MRIPTLFIQKEGIEEKVESLLKISDNETQQELVLERLNYAYQEFLKDIPEDLSEMYKKAYKAAKELSYRLDDVEAFVDEEDFKWFGEATGIYVSALINKVIRKNDKATLHPSDAIVHLGTRLRKGTLVIMNSVGNSTGYCMTGGKIVIEGHAGNDTGQRMSGGKIIVSKSAGRYTGCSMEGGSITVKENAGPNTGYNMKKGAITICGDSGYLTGYSMAGGRITVKGDSGKDTGEWMWSGKIIVKGKIESIGPHRLKGTIIRGDKVIKKAGRIRHG